MVSFKTIEFNTAKDFLEALRMTNPLWLDHDDQMGSYHGWSSNWIFRGQANAEWSLKPSALRSKCEGQNFNFQLVIDNLLSTREEINSKITESLSKRRAGLGWNTGEHEEECQKAEEAIRHALAEWELVEQFIQFADTLGYSTPPIINFHVENRHTDPLYDRRNIFISNYPYGFFKYTYNDSGNGDTWTHPRVALAQHHRIPTRLLDWTQNALIAAYFAAEDSIDKQQNDQKIAVYAIHKGVLQGHIRLVNVPQSNNVFLRAQDGVFTYDDRTDVFYIENGKYPGLEESLRFYESSSQSDIPIIAPRKLTLPASLAPEFLRLLWLERVTTAHLMPTLDNVSVTVKLKYRLMDKLNGQ